MNKRIPRVTVGLPVYNGGRYLAEAVESYLGQTFEDLELLILDNASTDGTPRICQHYARADERVRYVRAKQNTGLIENFNRTFRLARGTYFKWAAHDDLCAPTFVERCVELLDADPQVVLAHTGRKAIDENSCPLPYDAERKAFIDRQGHARHVDECNQSQMLSADVVTRFRAAMHNSAPGHEIYGLLRASALRKTRLLRFYGFDRLLVSELALQGRFAKTHDRLYLPRYHAENSDFLEEEDWTEMLTGGAYMNEPSLPIRSAWNHFAAAATTPGLSLAERMGCLRVVIAHATHRTHQKIMGG